MAQVAAVDRIDGIDGIDGDEGDDGGTERLSLGSFRPGVFALRDTWFPMAHAPQVRRRLVRRAMHGRPVHLWRDQGVLRATEDHPADLDRGRRRASEFTGGSGDYPLVERYGYAWVWYGDPANASPDLIPNIPAIPREGLPRHMTGNVLFDCSYELVCENLLDLTHADYLHSTYFGDPLADDDQITVESTSETVTMIRTAIGRTIPKAMRPLVRGDRQDVCLHTHVFVRSGVCVLHGDFDPGPAVHMVHPANPELARRTRTPVVFNVLETSKAMRHLFPQCAHPVGRGDNRATSIQNQMYLMGDERKDLNSRFDRAGIRYRRIYNELVARQMQGDDSYLADGDPGRDLTEALGVNRRREGRPITMPGAGV